MGTHEDIKHCCKQGLHAFRERISKLNVLKYEEMVNIMLTKKISYQSGGANYQWKLSTRLNFYCQGTLKSECGSHNTSHTHTLPGSLGVCEPGRSPHGPALGEGEKKNEMHKRDTSEEIMISAALSNESLTLRLCNNTTQCIFNVIAWAISTSRRKIKGFFLFCFVLFIELRSGGLM